MLHGQGPRGLLFYNVIWFVATGELPHPGLAQYSNAHFVGSADSDSFMLPSANDAEEGMSFSVDGKDTTDGKDNTDCDNSNTLTCPNTAAMDEDAGAHSFRSNFMYTTDQKWTVSLLKILDHANAPDYTFGEVLEWARSASANSYSYNPVGGLSRSKNVDALINSVRNEKKLLPFVRRIDIDHGSPSDVICFDFVAQLLSLLQNPSIMTAKNLAIDINDPLKPYFELEHSNVLGKALSGSVYRKVYNRLITDPEKQLFVPIIQWIDCTSVTGNDCFSLNPYMFTPAIFTEKFRRSIKAWGYHGFLPKRKSSSAQRQALCMGDAIRNYHKELAGVLESFCNCSPHLCGVYLPIGPKGRIRVDIVTCVLFIIQDVQEGEYVVWSVWGSHQWNPTLALML